jgi:hypothetical protein
LRRGGIGGFPRLQHGALVLARCKTELLARLDERLHGVIVWVWIIAADVALDASLCRLTPIRKLLDEVFALMAVPLAVENRAIASRAVRLAGESTRKVVVSRMERSWRMGMPPRSSIQYCPRVVPRREDMCLEEGRH